MSIYLTFFPGNCCANYKSKYDYSSIHLDILHKFYYILYYVSNIILNTFIYNKVNYSINTLHNLYEYLEFYKKVEF